MASPSRVSRISANFSGSSSPECGRRPIRAVCSIADRGRGEKEQLFNEVLGGLDLHRPPCSALIANQVYYLIGALAYDLMTAIKILDLKDDCQGWRVKTMMKKLLMLPGRLSQRSRHWVARVMVPGSWLNWWQRWVARVWPQYDRGRPKAVSMAL